jgi:hypothetical protein
MKVYHIETTEYKTTWFCLPCSILVYLNYKGKILFEMEIIHLNRWTNIGMNVIWRIASDLTKDTC